MNISPTQPFFYVIMPLGYDAQAEKKQTAIHKVARTRGFYARFPEYQKEAYSFDLHSTLENFKQAWFILVDLSFERPSCYYELGIAEALGVKVYLFAMQGTDIHQTANREAVQFYENLEHLSILVDETMKKVQDISKD